jgi:hypothetical protein
VHAELAHRVACRRDDAAIARAAHDDGFTGKARIVALFNRCIERIHVHVQNGARRLQGKSVPIRQL